VGVAHGLKSGVNLKNNKNLPRISIVMSF